MKKSGVDLDIRLVDLYVKKQRKAFVKKCEGLIKDSLRKIGHYSTTEPIRQELLQHAAGLWEKWVNTKYRTCIAVWKKQGNKKTPQFCKYTLQKQILPEIETGWDFVAEFSNAFIKRAPALIRPLLKEDWEPHRTRIAEEWKDKLEIEAAELGHSQKTSHMLPSQALTPAASQKRASDVARVIDELNTVRPRMYGGYSDFDALEKENPEFLTFEVTKKHPQLKEKVLNLQGHRQHKRLAQELVAAHHGRELSTVRRDWMKYKPTEFRRNPR